MKQVIFLIGFVVVAVYGLIQVVNIYDELMTVGRMRETPAVRPHEEPLLIMEQGTVPFQQSEELVRIKLEQDRLPTEMPAGHSQVDFGKQEYQAFCSHCHGEDLDGYGTVGQSFNPIPIDLTGERVTQMSDADIFYTISYGTARSPALASSMSVESRNAVIQYIRFKQGVL